MAESPSHRFGQIVGGLLEQVLHPPLQAFCSSRGLFLDKQGPRKPARQGQKVTWVDGYGNSHDFDFVIERGGTKDVVGKPVAFIEAAWRRYTKHSRNKAQEIQGAVVPVAEKHSWDVPFKGAVIAGEFTEASLTQLRSLGFVVLHIPYETIVGAFAFVGVDARFDESTPDSSFLNCVKAIEALAVPTRATLIRELTARAQPSLDKFLTRLEMTVDRQLDFIAVVPLYGKEHQFATIDDAREFLNTGAKESNGEFRRYEIIVRYTGGDSINASFTDVAKALSFLDYVGGQSGGSA
jgi:hypothetical protein